MSKNKYHKLPGISHKDPNFYDDYPEQGAGPNGAMPLAGQPTADDSHQGNLDQGADLTRQPQQTPFNNLRSK